MSLIEGRQPALSNIYRAVKRGLALLAVLLSAAGVQAAPLCRDIHREKASFEEQLKPVRHRQSMVPVSKHTRTGFEVAKRGKDFVVIENETTIERGMYDTVYEYPSHFVEVSRPFLSRNAKVISQHAFADRKAAEDYINQRMEPLEDVEDAFSLRKAMANRLNRFEVNEGGRQRLSRKIFESLSFVLKEYKGRKGWPPEFLEKLLIVALQYAYHSTYVNVRARNVDGTPGGLIGTIRNIHVPYVHIQDPTRLQALRDSEMIHASGELNQLLGNEMGALYPELHLDFENVASRNYSKRFGLDPDLAQALFQKKHLFIDGYHMMMHARIDGNLAYIPTPMERVLDRYYPQHRPNADETIHYFDEPGNFAVTPDRELPENLRKISGPSLYFHAARILREEAGAQGATTKIGTYASVGGASDRLYRQLGLKLEETLSGRDDSQNPTPEPWNVLLGDGNALETALKTRLGIEGLEDRLGPAFGNFDRMDQNYLKGIQHIFP